MAVSGHTQQTIPRPRLKLSVLYAAAALAGPGLAGACLEPQVNVGSDATGVFREVVNTPALLRNEVDLLFVVDNTADMQARQVELGRIFATMLENLAFGRGLPDLHIGVVSTDMGVGRYGDVVEQCTSTGDGGALLSPSLRGCANSTDSFLAYSNDGENGRKANFDGDIVETFRCMTQLGESGCDYEQPLEAMRSSLFKSQTDGFGFLRPNAVLGIVVLTNEDDCSAFNSELFDPDAPSFGGDSANFRCFQSGVVCDGDDVYQPGTRDGCRPHPESSFITAVGDYVQFLDGLKENPEDIVVTAIIGDPGNVVVGRDEQDMAPELLDVCKAEGGASAFPGIRLSAFAAAFKEAGQTTSICNNGATGELRGMVRTLRQSLGTTCLEGEILDIDAQEPGRQVDCRVFERNQVSQGIRHFVQCDNPGNLGASSIVPCYAIQTGGEICGDFETQLALQIHGRENAPENTRLIAECRVNE